MAELLPPRPSCAARLGQPSRPTQPLPPHTAVDGAYRGAKVGRNGAAMVGGAVAMMFRLFYKFKVSRRSAFEVRDLGAKGMGVVAARKIQKGELLLREQPLLVVSHCQDSRQLGTWEQEIEEALGRLPDDQLRSFWSLSDCHSETKTSAVGIVRTNALPIETAQGDMVGVYANVSRFNHSCNNNVNNSYQEEHGEVLHAIRDVEAGEELCITYIDLFMTRQERQEALRRTFNFKCTCPSCLQTGRDLLLSNEVRQRLSKLRSALPSAVAQGLGNQVMEKLIELIDQELEGNAAAKTYAYHMGFQLMKDVDPSKALTYAKEALEESKVSEGPESWVSQMLQSVIAEEKPAAPRSAFREVARKKWLIDLTGALVSTGRTSFAASRSEVNIHGVQDCVEYAAEICCRNAEGFGEYSMASDSVANIDAKGQIGGMQLVIHEGASDVPVMVPQGDGKMKVRWTLPEEAKQTIVKLRRVGNQNWYLCTGGAIAAPATETLATGLEEGIEYEAMVSFFINNRWCCESPISKPACIGELKLPAPPTQPKEPRLYVMDVSQGIMRVRWQYFSCVPPLSGALVRFRAVGARKWLFAHPSSGALIDVSPEKEPDLIPFPQTEVDVRGLPLGIRFEACVAFRNKLGTGPFSKESEIGHIGMLAARMLKCTYCFQDFDLQTAEYTRALENFWCPLCRFRHLDPFNAIVEQSGILRHHMFMRPSVSFNLDLPELKAWRKEDQSIFARCIKVNSDITAQVWPTKLIVVINGAEVFRIEPPEEGHVRRDVPKDISAGLRPGMNSVTVSIEDEHPSSYAFAIVRTQPRTAEQIAEDTNSCEEDDALRRVCMLLKDTWGIKEVENGDAKEEFQKEPEDEKMEDAENAPKAEPDKLEEKDIPEKDADEKDEAKPAPEPELPNGTATIDSDEEVTCVLSNKLKLRCPLSFERVDIPVRGETCMHLQCFGLAAYLESNLKMRALNNSLGTSKNLCWSGFLEESLDAMGQSASTAEMPEAQEGQHTISLAATEIIRVAGMSGYHTSVIVDDQEYFFDSIGILEAKPLFSHMLPEPPEPDIDATGLDLPPSRHPSGPLRSPSREPVVTRIGSSAYSGRDLVAALHQYFERGTYDVFYKNCNTFTDAALYFLTKTRMPAYCNRIERLVTATDPVSVSLLNRIFKAMVEHQQGVEVEGDIYVPNPLSAGFSVEKLIRKLEGESETESSGSDSEESEDEPPSLARRLSELPSKLVSGL
ncbi:unnamed protein product [Durusdinium trenchii]|uniref:SET domain-containing protein n=1 Tax=Durusdinium trenchii TaxID=1381693 RepID=A0ABP0NY53_9DINO